MRLQVRAALAASAVLALTVGLAGPTASAASGTPGAPGAGDRLFPGLGNGGYDVKHYDIDFDWDADAKTVDASVGITARATQALSRFNLDFDGNEISRVTVDGRAADYRRDGGELVVTPPRTLRGTFRVDVTYTADPRAEHGCVVTKSGWLPTPEGFGLAGQPDCTHSAYPVNDVPSDKATYTISVDTPKQLQSVANGELTDVTRRAGRVTRTFDSTDPIASELVQIAVGDFGVYEHKADEGTPLRDLVPAKQLDASKKTLRTQEQHLAWMTRQVGVRYPFQNYGSLGLEGDFGFALETQTISLYPAETFTNGQPFVPLVMMHELAHQWYGDYVSPATWSDIWLNEGHATWYELSYGEEFLDEPMVEAMKKTYAAGDQYRADFGPVAKPNSAANVFSDNVYSGGALVLFALHEKVGDRKFRQIEKQWVLRNANGVAGTDDFVTLASRVAGRDLHGFLESWVYGTKTPPMPGHPDWTVDPVGSKSHHQPATTVRVAR